MSSKSIRSQRLLRATIVGATVLALLAVGGAGVMAQSGSRSRPTNRHVAMDGYCPVCVIALKKWVRGTSRYQATYDGKTYYFPGEKQKATFLADPAKYVPALGGDCTVCYAKAGKRVPGRVYFASLHDQRLFLFPSAAEKRQFDAHPKQYADVDLALGGNCAVCQVELNKYVPGKPEIAAYHQGLRYLFPSERQRKIFLANPAKYVVNSADAKRTASKSAAG